jgi:hypothetical protein
VLCEPKSCSPILLPRYERRPRLIAFPLLSRGIRIKAPHRLRRLAGCSLRAVTRLVGRRSHVLGRGGVFRPGSRSASMPAQNRQLVPQHENLQLLRALATAEQHDQLEQPTHDDVHQRQAQRRPPEDGLRTLPRHQRVPAVPKRSSEPPDRVFGPHDQEPPGAGVGEPRRPRPFGPAGVMMLDPPDSD